MGVTEDKGREFGRKLRESEMINYSEMICFSEWLLDVINQAGKYSRFGGRNRNLFRDALLDELLKESMPEIAFKPIQNEITNKQNEHAQGNAKLD